MPELPDLEVFSQNLNKKLASKKLHGIKVVRSSNINVSKTTLKKKVEKQTISRIYREGKELRFAFKNKQVIGLHLMLRGKLVWKEGKEAVRHTLLELSFDRGLVLAVTDYQHAAKITLNPAPSDVPDALSKKINISFWKKNLLSNAKIKNLLLDQHVIRGIGNAYADEILWEARISPFSISNKLPLIAIKKLQRSVSTVLKKAIDSVRSASPAIIGGEIRSFLVIHNSKKKLSPTGAIIKSKPVGGRKTYYTDEQVLYQ